MSSPSFQLIDPTFSGGEYGTSYGDSPYGGPYGEPFVLPALQYPSDDLQGNGQRITGEIEHKRHGFIVGRRKWASTRRWHLYFRAQEQDIIDSFEVFYLIRKFWMQPWGGDTGGVVVHWMQKKFDPDPLRGGYYDLKFDIEEAVT